MPELGMRYTDRLPSALSSKATFSLAKVTLRNNIDRRFVRIPNFTYSKQTLQYLGYTEQRAEELWEAWREHARAQVETFGQFPFLVLERAFRQAVKVPFIIVPSRDEVLRFYVNSSDTSDDWVAIMNKFGLTKELQRAILHPEFNDIRSYHTLWNWFRETFDLRLIALDDVRRASFWRGLPQRTKSYMPRPRLENHVAISPVPNCVHNPHHPNQLARLRPPFEPPLMSIFWKPIDIYRTCGDFLGNGRLVDALSPHQVADFCEPHTTNLALYQDRAVAEKMARYASVRTNGFSRAAILKVSIPLAFIARCRMVVLSRLSDAWKEVVYEHRNFRNLKEHPTLRYVHQAQLIVGDMSCNGSTSFYKMDGWEDVSDEHVLEVEVERMGRKEKVKPMQWVFRTDTHPMQAEGAFWHDLKNVIEVEVVML
jgi:hypothetical protein